MPGTNPSLKRKHDGYTEENPSLKRSREGYDELSGRSRGIYEDATKERDFFKVTGTEFESEHVVGYQPLSGGLTRRESTLAREIENKAPAYLEERGLHRTQIGTGNRLKTNRSLSNGEQVDSGFNAQTYRSTQRSLLESGDISTSAQINQLDYAFNPTFRNSAGEVSDLSYDNMVRNMSSVRYVSNRNTGLTSEIRVSNVDRAEMYLARRAARTGKYPTLEEENSARASFDLPAVQGKSLNNSPSLRSFDAVVNEAEPSLQPIRSVDDFTEPPVASNGLNPQSSEASISSLNSDAAGEEALSSLAEDIILFA